MHANPGFGGYLAPTPQRRTARLVVAGLLGLLATGLGIAGMLTPYVSYTSLKEGALDLRQDVTAWSISYAGPSAAEVSAEGARLPVLYGVVLTLLLAGVLLGTTFTLQASKPGRASARLRPARTVAVASLAATVSITLLLTFDVVAWLSYDTADADIGDYQSSYNIAVGYWLLLGMAAFAIVAALLTLAPIAPRDSAQTGNGGEPRLAGIRRREGGADV